MTEEQVVLYFHLPPPWTDHPIGHSPFPRCVLRPQLGIGSLGGAQTSLELLRGSVRHMIRAPSHVASGVDKGGHPLPNEMG